MFSYILRGRKSEKKAKKEEKRKRKEKEKLRESAGIRIDEAEQRHDKDRTARISTKDQNNDRIVQQADKKERKSNNSTTATTSKKKNKRPRWHCSHCNRFNSSSKSHCSKCSLPRRPKSFIVGIVSQSSGSSIIEDGLAPTTPATTLIETPRSLAPSEASPSLVSTPPSSITQDSTITNTTATTSPRLIPTKSASLNFIPELEQSDAIVRTPVRQLLEERKAKLRKREQQQRNNTNRTRLKRSKSAKNNKSNNHYNNNRIKKKGSKKKRKKNAIRQKKDSMKEVLQTISTGSSVYPKDAEQSCPFTRCLSQSH